MARVDYWTVNNGERLCDILLEDTEFGTRYSAQWNRGIQGRAAELSGSADLSLEQNADRMIGLDKITELAVQQVISEDWVYPNDPRVNAITQQ